MLVKNLYVLKGYGANDWLRSFPLKAGNYEHWMNYWEIWKMREWLTGD